MAHAAHTMALQAYNFHMCWTQGKKDKLKYMKASGMWYLSEKSSDMIMATSTPSKYRTFDAMSKDMCSKEQGWM
jgi:hypothetical protein